jgi:cyclopropane fatty-acyl-phospholipid synthase-like methyltransferase
MSIREETDFEHDAFSPPWFLGLDDSMGKYSREGTMQGEEIQDHYGEALIEMRKIEDVSPDFLEGYTSNKDNFLRNPETIETQASALFYALRNFQKKLNTSKDFLKETLKKTISVSCYSYAH